MKKGETHSQLFMFNPNNHFTKSQTIWNANGRYHTPACRPAGLGGPHWWRLELQLDRFLTQYPQGLQQSPARLNTAAPPGCALCTCSHGRENNGNPAPCTVRGLTEL